MYLHFEYIQFDGSRYYGYRRRYSDGHEVYWWAWSGRGASVPSAYGVELPAALKKRLEQGDYSSIRVHPANVPEEALRALLRGGQS